MAASTTKAKPRSIGATHTSLHIHTPSPVSPTTLKKAANPHRPARALAFRRAYGRADTPRGRRVASNTSPAMRPPGRRGLLFAGACALLLAAFYLVAALVTTPLAPYLLPPLALSLPCLPAVAAPAGSGYGAPGLAALADAAVAYATMETVPQQSRDEISLSLAVLRRRAPLELARESSAPARHTRSTRRRARAAPPRPRAPPPGWARRPVGPADGGGTNASGKYGEHMQNGHRSVKMRNGKPKIENEDTDWRIYRDCWMQILSQCF